MRVLVSVFPGRGHFHPLAPLALQLQARGHDVLVATGPDLVEWVAACGLTARPAGLSEHDAVRRARDDAPPGTPFGPFMFARTAPEPMLADLRRLCESWAPDLVLHDEAELAAPLLASELGVACVTHSWPAPAMAPEARARAAGLLAPLWELAGCGAARTTGELYLDCCPPPLQTEAIGALGDVRTVRPHAFDGPVAADPYGLDRLPRPLAYVTLGTVAVFARAEVLTMAAAAAAAQAASVIVTTGPVAATDLGPLPRNVQVAGYLPQRRVLEHADVVVSHGGAGTVVGGLLYGVPQLVLPQGAPSQQRNGDQLARLGAGLTISADRQTEAPIGTAVTRLLSDDAFRAAAAAVADTLSGLPDAAAVASELERRFG